MEFKVTSSVIDPAGHAAGMGDARAGAFVHFEGRVRDHNEGKFVHSLEYEAYVPLAEKEGMRILEEAQAKFAILGARCAHRTGVLRLGDVAVWVGVAAGHRGDAFGACRYIIDEIKARLPVWKKEHYSDGASDWINCATRTGPVELKEP
jgi:molybdopterin synthase catalytic subunit